MADLVNPMTVLKPILDEAKVQWAIAKRKNGKTALFIGERLTGAWPTVGITEGSRHWNNLVAQVHRNITLAKASKAGIIVPEGGIIRPQPGRPNPQLRTPDDPIEGRFIPQPQK